MVPHKAEKSLEQVEKDTCFAETCTGLSQKLPLRLPGSFHNTGDCGPHMLYLCMTAFVYGCGTTPIRRSLLDVPPTVDPAGPRRGANLTVRFSVNPRESCGLLSDPDFSEANQGLSHFHDLRGRDFAFMVNNTGIEPVTFSSVKLTLYQVS